MTDYCHFSAAVQTFHRGKVMEDALIVLEEDGYSVGALMKFCESYKFYGFPIVTNQETGILLGYLSRDATQKHLRKMLDTNQVSEKTRVPGPTLRRGSLL